MPGQIIHKGKELSCEVVDGIVLINVKYCCVYDLAASRGIYLGKLNKATTKKSAYYKSCTPTSVLPRLSIDYDNNMKIRFLKK